MEKIQRWVLSLCLIVCISPAIALSTEIASALTVESVTTSPVALGDALKIKINGLSAALSQNKYKLSDFILYIDGHPIPFAASEGAFSAGSDELAFLLTREDLNRLSWDPILGAPRDYTRKINVSIGLNGQAGVLPNTVTGVLTVVDKGWLIIMGAALIAVAFILVIASIKGEIIRDATPADFAGAKVRGNLEPKRTYSLSQFQMAWWFFIILGSYLFLLLVTHNFTALSTQALMLMGISATTAGFARMIEVNKANPTLDAFTDVVTQINSAKAKQVPAAAMAALFANRDLLAAKLASKGFIQDVLSDVSGISLHRLQNFIWTLVLSFVFIAEVYRHLAMPEFDGTTLALLGISGGTYLGFKVPEQAT